MDSDDALVMVFSRNVFYRRLHFLALAAFGLMIIMIGILIWVLFYISKNQSPPVYFATDNVSRLVKVAPVEKPVLTTEDVIEWTTEAVQAAYSYDYLNYRGQLQSSQKYFTPYGWSKYIAALDASNNLVGVRERKLVGIAKVVDQPKVLEEGLLGGSYAWKIQIAVLMTYLRPPKYDVTTQRVDPIILNVLVQRQSLLQSYKGLGIVQIVGEFAKTPIGQQQDQSQAATQ
jgi:intracellular multiplication protein IcmL